MKASILVIDGEETNSLILIKILAAEGHDLISG